MAILRQVLWKGGSRRKLSLHGDPIHAPSHHEVGGRAEEVWLVGKWGKGAWLPRQLPEGPSQELCSHRWGLMLSWRLPGSIAKAGGLGAWGTGGEGIRSILE